MWISLQGICKSYRNCQGGVTEMTVYFILIAAGQLKPKTTLTYSYLLNPLILPL